MSQYIKEFSKNSVPIFKKFEKQIDENDWSDIINYNDSDSKKFVDSLLESKKELAKLQFSLAETIANRLKTFNKKAEADKNTEAFKKVMRYGISIIEKYTDRVDSYCFNLDLDKIPTVGSRTTEVEFTKDLFKWSSNLGDKLADLNFSESDDMQVGIKFYGDVKATLPMHDFIAEDFPEIKDKLDALGIDFNSEPKNEMYINIENPPKYNPKKHYWEQEKDTIQFWLDELKKCKNGVYIDDQYIAPWTYYHINHFTTRYPSTKINKHTKEEETIDIIGTPPLRDNEWWLIQDTYLDAKKQGKMMFVAATRRAAKTTMLASHLGWCATIGKKQLLCASGSSKDLGQIKDYFLLDCQNKNHALRVIQLTNDWEKPVDFGIKGMDGKNKITSSIKVINLDAGGNKSSEILAGYTPDALIIDEVMKLPFKDQLEAAKPALDSPGGKRCVAILTGTSGNSDLAKDAFSILRSPEDNGILPMNYNRFDEMVPEHLRTYKKIPFGTFLPGHMSAKDGCIKIDTNLAEYLGKPEAKNLRKIKIKITNWELANKVIQEDRRKKKGDAKGYIKEVLYFPICPSELFLSTKTNPFNPELLSKVKEDLLQSGDHGKKVTLHETNSGIYYEETNKSLAEYPHKGGFVDAPIVLFEEIPEETPPDFLYVAGFDDYKQEESDTDSVGAFYIYKVNIGMIENAGTIVASIATRPNPHSSLHEQIFLLQKAFNAKCFMENADDGYKQFLDRRRLADRWLYTSIDFKSDIAQNGMSRRKFGWTPTPQNIKFLKNLLITYINEDIEVKDENNVVINSYKGGTRIKDLGLLEELINYSESANVDRVTAFMSCLGIEYYLHTNWMLPTLSSFKKNKEVKQKRQEFESLATRMYGNNTRQKRYF